MDTTDSKSQFLPTRESLLSRLRQMDDHASWQEFYDLYYRLLFSFAVRKGLTGAEAEDVVQETLLAVAKTMPKFRYQPDRCSFKSWLRRLADARIADHYRASGRRGAGMKVPLHEVELMELESAVEDPNGSPHDPWWDQEWREKVMESAKERVKKLVSPQQYRIFHALVVQELSGAEVAAQFDVNLASVYVARHRVAAKLKKEVRHLEKNLSDHGSLE